MLSTFRSRCSLAMIINKDLQKALGLFYIPNFFKFNSFKAYVLLPLVEKWVTLCKLYSSHEFLLIPWCLLSLTYYTTSVPNLQTACVSNIIILYYTEPSITRSEVNINSQHRWRRKTICEAVFCFTLGIPV